AKATESTVSACSNARTSAGSGRASATESTVSGVLTSEGDTGAPHLLESLGLVHVRLLRHTCLLVAFLEFSIQRLVPKTSAAFTLIVLGLRMPLLELLQELRDIGFVILCHNT